MYSRFTCRVALFAAVPIGNDSIVAYYYGSFVFENMTFSLQVQAFCLENVIALTTESFQKGAIRLSHIATKQMEVQRLVWTVPVPTGLMSYLNYDLYLAEEAPALQRVSGAGRLIVDFCYTEPLDNGCVFNSWKTLALRALPNIANEEELFKDDGNSYDFLAMKYNLKTIHSKCLKSRKGDLSTKVIANVVMNIGSDYGGKI